MLEVKGLTKNFGGLAALSDIDMSVKPGEFAGLIGPNGAGKTTFFNLISGVIKPTKGRIIFDNHNITGKSTHSIAKKGAVRTFQAINIFPEFTVLKNIILSYHRHSGIGLFETVLHTPGSRRKEKEVLDRTREILKKVGLEKQADVTAGKLAHGHKRILGIAIALAANPKLLLLDEPLGGMNGGEVTETIKLISKLWKSGITILLIEHNMRAAMSLCQKITVLNFGRKIAEGSPKEIKKNKEVIRAYLGAD